MRIKSLARFNQIWPVGEDATIALGFLFTFWWGYLLGNLAQIWSHQ